MQNNNAGGKKNIITGKRILKILGVISIIIGLRMLSIGLNSAGVETETGSGILLVVVGIVLLFCGAIKRR